MKKSQYTAEQVAFALRQAATRTPVPEVCRKIGISEQTFYRWKKRYFGMGIAEVKKLKILEEESRRAPGKGLIRRDTLGSTTYYLLAPSVI